ncbi:uncharacterized protein LOC128164061 isoform X2 [Crassostrea angulata]|uniref:uncharacterized protein LOC128164061 isoform X2 n=1 Tax=Magallana angulata TaxID=2784310 RepID=UPI0022B139F7|nr:uncharacterized protein LOC128164061 isoform X2 [Crassostrea angulata]
MTTQRNFMCGILILAIGVLKENIVFVRSVCLQDALTFYNSKKDACSFRKDDFNRIFLSTRFDNSKECQINCSINSSKPQYSNLGDKKYEVINMEIRFTSTSYKFPLKTLCSNGTIENFDIDLDCEGEYLHVRGIGERCVNASQCLSVNVNSTCNETIGLCQCKTGYQCLSGTSTRLPTPELGGQCNDSKQCKEVDQYSVCSRDNICKCNKGYTEISDYRLKEERSDNSALVFGVGIAGFVLGVAVCGLFYIIMIRYRNRSQAKSDKRREDCTEKGSVLVSQTSTPHPNYNKTLGDNFEGNDVYNHLHEAPNEVSVQPDYDHVPPQVEENGDYSHMTTRNAHSSDIAGEYGMIS